jgi:hypothetical protein
MGVWFRFVPVWLMHIKGFLIYPRGVRVIFRAEIHAFDGPILSNLYLD